LARHLQLRKQSTLVKEQLLLSDDQNKQNRAGEFAEANPSGAVPASERKVLEQDRVNTCLEKQDHSPCVAPIHGVNGALGSTNAASRGDQDSALLDRSSNQPYASE
jgi:hypothetical protein